MTTDELPLTLDKREVAKHLNLSKRTIERLRATGAFPPPLPGLRRLRWSTHIVLDWLRTNGERTKIEEDRT